MVQKNKQNMIKIAVLYDQFDCSWYASTVNIAWLTGRLVPNGKADNKELVFPSFGDFLVTQSYYS